MTQPELSIADHQVITAVVDELRWQFQEPGADESQLRGLVKDLIPHDQLDDLRKDRAMYRAYLTKAATRVLAQWRTRMLYRLDRYVYRPVDVVRMLREIGDMEKWESTYVPQDAKWIKGNDSMEVLADILLAMPKVSRHNREVLFRTYWLSHEPEGPEQSKAVREAVIELTQRMTNGR